MAAETTSGRRGSRDHVGLGSADKVGEVDEAQRGGAEDHSKGVVENHDIETTRDRHIDPQARDTLRPGSHGEPSLPRRYDRTYNHSRSVVTMHSGAGLGR